MTQVYFRCCNPKEVLVDRCGAVVDDLAEARDHAACVVRSLTMARSLEDWRSWDESWNRWSLVPHLIRTLLGSPALEGRSPAPSCGSTPSRTWSPTICIDLHNKPKINS